MEKQQLGIFSAQVPIDTSIVKLRQYSLYSPLTFPSELGKCPPRLSLGFAEKVTSWGREVEVEVACKWCAG